MKSMRKYFEMSRFERGFLILAILSMVFAPCVMALTERGNWYYPNEHKVRNAQMDSVKELTSGAGVVIDNDVKIKDGDVLFEGVTSSEMWVGAPLAVRPGSWYELFNDFVSAGYTADAATTNSLGAAIPGSIFSETADRGSWLVTVTDDDGDGDESVTIADDGAGGWLVVNTTDKANDALNIQMNGEAVAVTATKDLWFEAKFEVEDVSEDTVFVGLTVADTDILGSLGNDFMGFYLDQSGVVSFQTAKNGTITTNAAIATLVDATATVGASAQTFSFYVDGSAGNVYVYLDGAVVAANVGIATIPNDEALSPAMAILTTDTGADYLRLDYIKVQAQR